eukprot:RCo043426
MEPPDLPLPSSQAAVVYINSSLAWTSPAESIDVLGVDVPCAAPRFHSFVFHCSSFCFFLPVVARFEFVLPVSRMSAFFLLCASGWLPLNFRFWVVLQLARCPRDHWISLSHCLGLTSFSPRSSCLLTYLPNCLPFFLLVVGNCFLAFCFFFSHQIHLRTFRGGSADLSVIALWTDVV